MKFLHTCHAIRLSYMAAAVSKEKHVPCGVTAINYAARADFQTANAVPTAEAALGIAMRELPVTLAGLPVLVVGYGRIGKVLVPTAFSVRCQSVCLGTQKRRFDYGRHCRLHAGIYRLYRDCCR